MNDRTPAWEKRYGRKLVFSDTITVTGAVAFAQFARYGVTAETLSEPVSTSSLELSYTALSLALIAAWLGMLAVSETRKPQNFGAGYSEYRRVVSATLMTFGLFAVLGFALQVEIGRGYLLIALPLGLFALLATRLGWRKRLHKQRRRGKNIYKTMLVGEATKVAHIHREMLKDVHAGFKVVAISSGSGGPSAARSSGVERTTYSELLPTVDELDIDTVIITGADDLSPNRLQTLGWELDDRRVDLIVAAALTDVAGPRIHMRQAVGFPLIYVDYPKLSGFKRFGKRLFDMMGAAALIAFLALPMAAVAIAVKITSPGSVFYSQERIGANGKPFAMFKFRSMVQNADDQLASLLDQQGTSSQPLHKVHNDPRVTRVGRVLRRYSLDELPQLFNVFLGTMSLVGPRPQREAEVALYDKHHHRRLFVRPGITGLWQVSGRSSLDWGDAIRLDLYYVENWSPVADIAILWKTIRAVVTADGAH